MTDDSTLGGYLATHERPPAFQGSDGQPYSVAVLVDDEPAADGRFGGALLFVRWSATGDAPAGHVETEDLVWSDAPDGATRALHALTLHQVKTELDRAILKRNQAGPW